MPAESGILHLCSSVGVSKIKMQAFHLVDVRITLSGADKGVATLSAATRKRTTVQSLGQKC